MAEFRNPSQQGGGGQDNQSLLIMMVVMLGIFFGLQYFRAKSNPPATPGANKSAPAHSGTSQTAPAAAQTSGQTSGPTTAQAAASSAPAVQAAAPASTVVENELYRITFANRGGAVTSWVLKRFKDSAGHPLDLVHPQAAQSLGLPLSLYTYDDATTAQLNQALYVPSATGNLSAPGSLTFHYAANGLDVTKTFSFDQTYLIHADVAVTRNGAPLRALISWPGGFGDQDNPIAFNSAQLDTMRDSKEEHLAPKKIANGNTLDGPFQWAGVSDPYFAAVFLPDSPATTTLATFNHQIDAAKSIRASGSGRSGSGALFGSSKGPVMVPIVGAAIGDTSGHTSVRIFAGPKEVNVLRAIHPTGSNATLEPLLDFGFFGAIGKYLFLALQFIHSHVVASWPGSWGWAIVLLTVAINLLILPLRIKTMQSGLKMQRIQPQMDAIKEKYKKYKVTDPKRNDMNVEIMKLQKDNGVNMFGGCIPTLIQLPLLFAFFAMLPKVVELRQAHWFWLPDLTSADPYHILPIVMVLSQFLMQYYMPSPGVDPQQQKMMAFMMPAFSGYMTWNYASGLALYWSVGNLISIAQQAIMNRTSLGREMREIAAKRARRKGSATTIQGRR
ncbi:MAG TPA: membrane protein insertase YidC [Granulicella sp.]|nr:membrane protein insertase YidC [Granulicella sp.]